MILSGRTIRDYVGIEPFFERSKFMGMTFGLGPAGYDVRIRESVTLAPGEFQIASIVEHILMPRDVVGFVFDKSTHARRGLSLFNTVIEPGWRGYLTIELSNRGHGTIVLLPNTPIAQIQFHRTDTWCDEYNGKYQDQGPVPTDAIFE